MYSTLIQHHVNASRDTADDQSHTWVLATHLQGVSFLGYMKPFGLMASVWPCLSCCENLNSEATDGTSISTSFWISSKQCELGQFTCKCQRGTLISNVAIPGSHLIFDNNEKVTLKKSLPWLDHVMYIYIVDHRLQYKPHTYDHKLMKKLCICLWSDSFPLVCIIMDSLLLWINCLEWFL